MSRVITFGELMLRLAPEGYYRFVQADTLGATFGGGEANVAVSLANYGVDAAFVSKLPKHEIGQAAVNSLRKYGPGRRPGRHLLSGKRRFPAGFQVHLRPGPLRHCRSHFRRFRLG